MIHQFPITTHLISRHHHYDVFRILRFIAHLLSMVNIHIMYYPKNNVNIHYPSVVLNNYIITSLYQWKYLSLISSRHYLVSPILNLTIPYNILFRYIIISVISWSLHNDWGYNHITNWGFRKSLWNQWFSDLLNPNH